MEGLMDLNASLVTAKRPAAPSGNRPPRAVAALPDMRYCTMRSAGSGPESADQTVFDGPKLASAASRASDMEEAGEGCGSLLHLAAARGSGQGTHKHGFVSSSGSSWLLQWISSLELDPDNLPTKCNSTENAAAANPAEPELPWLIAAKRASEPAAPQNAWASTLTQPAQGITEPHIPGQPCMAGSPDVSPFAKAPFPVPGSSPEVDAASLSSPRSLLRMSSYASSPSAVSSSAAKVSRPRWNGSTRVEHRPSQPGTASGLRRVTSSRSLAPPSRMNSGSLAPPSRMDSGCLAPPSRMDSGCLAPPSHMDSGCLAPPSRMNSGRLAPPSRMASGSLAPPSRVDSGCLALPSRMDSGSLAPPSRMSSMGRCEPLVQAAGATLPFESMQLGSIGGTRVLGRILSGIVFEPNAWDVDGSPDASPFAALQMESFDSPSSARRISSAVEPGTDGRAGETLVNNAPSNAGDSKGSGQANAANEGLRSTCPRQQERPRTVQRSLSRFKKGAGQPSAAPEDSSCHNGKGNSGSAVARPATSRPNIAGTWGARGSGRPHAAAALHRSASSPAAPLARNTTGAASPPRKQASPCTSTPSSAIGAAGAPPLTNHDIAFLPAPEGASQTDGQGMSEGLDCVVDPMDVHLDTLNRLLADLAACKITMEMLCMD